MPKNITDHLFSHFPYLTFSPNKKHILFHKNKIFLPLVKKKIPAQGKINKTINNAHNLHSSYSYGVIIKEDR
jgi:hypothetical protein